MCVRHVSLGGVREDPPEGCDVVVGRQGDGAVHQAVALVHRKPVVADEVVPEEGKERSRTVRSRRNFQNG